MENKQQILHKQKSKIAKDKLNNLKQTKKIDPLIEEYYDGVQYPWVDK